MNSVRKTIQITPRFSAIIRKMGDKKDSQGSAGAIREAGGAFGKMEVAHEEEYFYKQRQQQLKELKDKKVGVEEFHEKSIQDHEEAIQRHKEAINQIRKK